LKCKSLAHDGTDPRVEGKAWHARGPVVRDQLPQPGARLRLGGALQVSPICVGMVARPEVVTTAFDAGINFFFVSADMHWPLYHAMRRGLEMLLERGGGIRDDIVVAGVSYATQPEFCVAPFHELLASVRGLGRLDVLIAGGAYGGELATRLPIYRRHRETALCGARAIGVTFHDRAAAAAEATRGDAELCLARYNSLHRGARDDLFPHVAARRALLFNFNSTFGYVAPERFAALGLDPETWVPDVSDHYRYAFSPPEVDGLLCRLDVEEHLLALVDALAQGPLAPEECEHLELLSDLALR
jgi:hypothetical protein